jgi:DNA-binding GntR family transcriptional regulator
MDLKLGGLERTTTPEGVYRVLRAAILHGTVPPGGQLRERDIAADLGVSRSPLREALTRLEEEGLIVKIPFRGAFVVEVRDQDIAEIASIRFACRPVRRGTGSRRAARVPSGPG